LKQSHFINCNTFLGTLEIESLKNLIDRHVYVQKCFCCIGKTTPFSSKIIE
jgi:hypothetical protein